MESFSQLFMAKTSSFLKNVGTRLPKATHGGMITSSICSFKLLILMYEARDGLKPTFFFNHFIQAINQHLSSSKQSFFQRNTTDPTSRLLPVFDKLIPLPLDEQLDSRLPSSGNRRGAQKLSNTQTDLWLQANTRDSLKSSAQNTKMDNIIQNPTTESHHLLI